MEMNMIRLIMGYIVSQLKHEQVVDFEFNVLQGGFNRSFHGVYSYL